MNSVFRRPDLRSQRPKSILSPPRKSSPCSFQSSSGKSLSNLALSFNSHRPPTGGAVNRPLHESPSILVTWIREPEDKYGTWENNTWTGMCGMLFREEVDIILNPLLPSAEFAEVAYYTNPVLYEAFTFLSGKEKQDGGLFLYFSVLEPSVWFSMAVALIVISLASALLYKRIFDEKWNAWIGSLGQYLWVYVAYMLRQNPHDKWMLREDKSLLSFLVVLLITVWVIGVSFLVMTVFQSLLVSKLTIIKSLPIVDSLEDFVSKTKVKGAVPVEIELQEVLKDSGIPLYEKAWEKMEETLFTSDQVFSDDSFQKVEMGEICIPHGQVFLKGVLNDYFKLHGRCDFHLSNNYFFPFPLLMGLRKSLPKKFQRKFDSGNNTRHVQLLTQKKADKGIETRITTGDADTFIVRSVLEKATSHPKGMHSVAETLHQIFIEKAKHYRYIVQKSTKPDKNIAHIFYNPSSTPDAISQTGEMFLAIYKAAADEHNFNNHRYAAFLKPSTKIKADLSSTKGQTFQHSFSNVFLFWNL
ncbi:hypothetical protein AVEN_148932-1 [Araneus ventricosus]|uniref:Ionotropic glutamate receptor L-glutamate and glycine-binding domain-containing protein n=1 Tax=Araneus ventricosus TaxID=182803 RepID=A0A4Y2P2N4_ARAVE|nr:hypothetical protein AVEN_148932-1 [Araneus ventricosus]